MSFIQQGLETPQTSTSSNPNIIFCTTCLSTSDIRKMYPIENKYLFNALTGIEVKDSNVKVCWECRAMLHKFKNFRLKAIKASFIPMEKLTHMHSPLTSLVQVNLNNWLSIKSKPQIVEAPIVPIHIIPIDTTSETEILIETNPETPENTIDVSLKEQIVESETYYLIDTEDTNLIEEEPFSLHSGVEIKGVEDSVMEDEHGHMDTVECEYDSGSDNEDFMNTAQAKTRMEITSHDIDDTNTASNSKPQKPRIVVTTYFEDPTPLPKSNISKSSKPPSQHKVADTASSLELPLGFVTSSLLTNSVSKPAVSTSQNKTSTKDETVEYHTGPKLFRNSPQATPEASRHTKASKQTTYDVKRLTQQEVEAYRTSRRKQAQNLKWQLFCDKCLEKFTKPLAYNEHLKKHDESAGPFKCVVCELRYRTRRQLDEHTEVHYRVFVCNKCTKQFYTVKTLQTHHEVNHEDVYKLCRYCNQRFTSIKEYNLHIKTHTQLVQCEHCDQKLHQHSLKAHIDECHETLEVLECHICHETVEGKKELSDHLRSAHGSSEDRHYCADCNVLFMTRAYYLKHLRTSVRHKNDEEKFHCPQCPRSFSTSWFLKVHIEGKHHNTEMYECDFCKKVYRSKQAVRSHIVQFHQKARQPSKRGDRVCEFCGKVFMTKACLQQHTNSHLNNQPHECDDCSATYSYSVVPLFSLRDEGRGEGGC